MLKVAGLPAAPVCPQGTGAAAGRVREGTSADVVGLFSPATTNKPVTVTSGADGCVSFHADYWSAIFTWGTGMLARETVLKGIAEHLFGVADAGIFVPTGYGKRHFPVGFKAPDGVTAGFREVEGGGSQLWVEVKSEGCLGAGLAEFQALTAWSWSIGCAVHVTRLDLAWDNPGFTVAQALQAVRADNVRTKAKFIGRIESETFRGKGDSGHTCNIGSRSSDRFLCIYDKRGPVRIELKLRDERANLAFFSIAHADREGKTLRAEGDQELHARGLLMDYVEFVDGDSDSNITRRSRLSWWAAFVEGASKFRQVIKRVEKSLERSIAWFKRSVVTTASMLMGRAQRSGQSLSDIASEWFDQGIGRLTAWQRAVLNAPLCATAPGDG